MDDSNIQQTVFCEKECPIEPPASKQRKIQSKNKHRTIQYTSFNEGEHINLLQFSNIWPSKINSNRQEKKQ